MSPSPHDRLVPNVAAFFAASMAVGLMRPPFGEGFGVALFVAVGGATWVAARALQDHYRR